MFLCKSPEFDEDVWLWRVQGQEHRRDYTELDCVGQAVERVQSLVGELRSRKKYNEAKKKKRQHILS